MLICVSAHDVVSRMPSSTCTCLCYSHTSVSYISQITECSIYGTCGWGPLSNRAIQSSITAIRNGKVLDITFPSVVPTQDVMICTSLPLIYTGTSFAGEPEVPLLSYSFVTCQCTRVRTSIACLPSAWLTRRMSITSSRETTKVDARLSCKGYGSTTGNVGAD